MNKKFISLVCVLALALCLAVPAFAADLTNDMSTNFEGKPADGEIAVEIQTGMTHLYVNPYGLPYTLGYGEVYTTAGATTFDKTKDFAIKEPDTSTEGFFSDTAVIRNNGSIKLDVKVSMTTTEQGALVFVAGASDVTAGSITKQVMYGNLEIAPATLASGTATVTKTAAVTGANPAPAVKEEQTDVQVITPDWANKKTVAIPAGAAGADTSDKFAATPGKGAASAVTNTQVVLPAAQTTTDSFGTSTTTPGYIAYRLAGTAVPADAAASGASTPAVWAEADVADITVAFTFTPHVDTPAGP